MVYDYIIKKNYYIVIYHCLRMRKNISGGDMSHLCVPPDSPAKDGTQRAPAQRRSSTHSLDPENGMTRRERQTDDPIAPLHSSTPRVVLHIDLDAFFVQVERSLNPTLVGKPMVVQQHADIIAVSYEARALGVRKHMPTATIRREHPSVKLVHV
ncbi:unnamed protein product, partial [Ectocarpus sp. 12 AP-2014]